MRDTIRLDATPQGRPVYERLGFAAEYDLVRMQGVGAVVADLPPHVAPCNPSLLDRLAVIDRQATGTQRDRLLTRLFAEWPDATAVAIQHADLQGYVLCRRGTHATLIGPAIATEVAVGRALLDAAFSRCAGQPVFVDIPSDNRPAMEWAAERGLSVQRPFTRMAWGPPLRDEIACIWASSGPEKG